jgi:hypothetical protein
MTVTQLIYASQPFGFDMSGMRQILLSAERNNTRDDITGALICREDLYLQLLEGPDELVEAAFKRIERDDRHISIMRLVSRPSTHRLFAQWAMRHDPARSWMWSRDEVAKGAIGAAQPESVVGVFERLSREGETAGEREAAEG